MKLFFLLSALCLDLPLEGKEKQVAEKLHELVAGNNYFLDFGVIGSKTVPRSLTKYGYVEDAMKMVTKTEGPSWGFYTRHAKGITFKNVAVTAKERDYRPAFVFDDVAGVAMENVYINEDDRGAQIILRNVGNENLKVDQRLVSTVE